MFSKTIGVSGTMSHQCEMKEDIKEIKADVKVLLLSENTNRNEIANINKRIDFNRKLISWVFYLLMGGTFGIILKEVVKANT